MSASKVTTVRLGTVEAQFTVKDPDDWIQREYLQGRFYEEKDLLAMAEYINRDTRYIDIGANIGNHIIYFAKRFDLKSIVAIDPNRDAVNILKENLALNNLTSVVNLSYVDYGLSDTPTTANLCVPEHNLGGTFCKEDKHGAVKIIDGDSLLANESFDFMKIDVEGMEINCLVGCEKLITRCRPVIYIEVDNSNMNAFDAWCSMNSYIKKVEIKHYVQNQNYLVIPE